MGESNRQGLRLDEEHTAFIQGAVSVVVCSRSADLTPDVVRGCGCRVSRDRRRVTVLVEPARAGNVLEQVAANGMIAVVFSQPSTLRTIQLKGTDARLVRVTATDRAIVERHAQAWVDDLCSIGYGREFARALHGFPGRGLAAISFTPAAAFQQTPGPAAGERLGELIVALTLHSLRPCLEGAVPAVIATCAPDGTPNVSYVSEVHYVDPAHVALSYQFFSKTRRNVLENPRATVIVIHPDTAAQYSLALLYLRTEDSGALFECMKAKLAGIASHTGMTGVFRLRGSDVYRVESITELCRTPLAPTLGGADSLALLRCAIARLSAAPDLARLLGSLLDGLREVFGIGHSMVLMRDPAGERLYTVESRGYPESGIGAEIRLGYGVIGAAALARTPIRISHATAEFGYGRAMREDARSRGLTAGIEEVIPFPGLPASQSQIAVPILAGDRLLGVLFAESVETGRFGYDEEDALVVLASHVGTVAALLEDDEDCTADSANASRDEARPQGTAIRLRRYAENDSIFVGEHYLIKGVAGAILWKLVRNYVDEGRTEHSNRELRLDPAIRLPDLSENLEARLILLQRRLEERCPGLRIEKTGRGRFRFSVNRPLTLSEVARPH